MLKNLLTLWSWRLRMRLLAPLKLAGLGCRCVWQRRNSFCLSTCLVQCIVMLPRRRRGSPILGLASPKTLSQRREPGPHLRFCFSHPCNTWTTSALLFWNKRSNFWSQNKMAFRLSHLTVRALYLVEVSSVTCLYKWMWVSRNFRLCYTMINKFKSPICKK